MLQYNQTKRVALKVHHGDTIRYDKLYCPHWEVFLGPENFPLFFVSLASVFPAGLLVLLLAEDNYSISDSGHMFDRCLLDRTL